MQLCHFALRSPLAPRCTQSSPLTRPSAWLITTCALSTLGPGNTELLFIPHVSLAPLQMLCLLPGALILNLSLSNTNHCGHSCISWNSALALPLPGLLIDGLAYMSVIKFPQHSVLDSHTALDPIVQNLYSLVLLLSENVRSTIGLFGSLLLCPITNTVHSLACLQNKQINKNMALVVQR